MINTSQSYTRIHGPESTQGYDNEEGYVVPTNPEQLMADPANICPAARVKPASTPSV